MRKYDHSLKCLGLLVSATALFATPPSALAAEQSLEFKFVVMPTDLKVVQASNIDGQILSVGKYFGVAYFKDGRVAVKDFIGAGDLTKGLGPIKGYSTYTFEDGSSITASYTGEFKETGAHGDYTILSGTGLYDKATGTGSFDSVPTKWTDGAVLLNGMFHVKTP
jgi:hypothetical protein